MTSLAAAGASHPRRAATVYLPARRRRPVAFHVHDGAFVAPPADQLTASSAVTLLAVGSVCGGIFLWPRSTDGLSGLIALGRACVVLLLIAFLLSIAVNYYLATIGTDEGYVHLRRVLRAG